MAQNKLRIKGVNTGGGGGNLTDFISVWDTTLGDGNPSISLPLINGGNYNFSVNWGDGNTDTITAWDQAEVTHTYAKGGTYPVTISGTIEGWRFNGVLSCQKITQITNIGQLKLINGDSYFAGCSNLTTINGILDLTGITSLSYMFEGCTLLTSVNGISSWDTSAVTNMDGMFFGATSFNLDINSWNVCSVTNMSSMFEGTTSFNQPLNNWDVSSVTNMSNMFYNATSFNQPLNSWNVSSVVDMNSMFAYATAFNQDISTWNVSSVTGEFSMIDFMQGKSTADYSYYDNLLNAWSLLTLQNGIELTMGTIEYTSAGATARQSIIDNYGWAINDGGLAAPEINYTFKTSRTIGSNVNISITTSTGYWKYNHNDVDSSVNSWNTGQIVVANSNGEFTIIPCLSDGTPSGSILSFVSSSSQITEFNGNGLSNLQTLGLQGNSLTSFNGTELSSLHTLSLQGNSLTSFNGTGLSSLTFLDLIGNQLTSLDISPVSNLSALYLADMYGLNSNPMTASSNDSVLNQLEANSINSGTFFTSGGRTSAGTSDYNALIGRGWTILGANLV